MAARRWGGQKLSVRSVFLALMGPEDSDQFFRLVVIRSQIVVSNRPIEALAIAAIWFEIVRAHAQGNPPPVIGAPAEHSRTPPHPVIALGAGVGLAFHLPSTLGGIKVSKWFLWCGSSPVRSVVIPLHHLGFLGGVVPASRLQHQALGARLGQDVGRHPAARPRADDNYVIVLGLRRGLSHGNEILGLNFNRSEWKSTTKSEVQCASRITWTLALHNRRKQQHLVMNNSTDRSFASMPMLSGSSRRGTFSAIFCCSDFQQRKV